MSQSDPAIVAVTARLRPGAIMSNADDMRMLAQCMRDELDSTTRKVQEHNIAMHPGGSLILEQTLAARYVEQRCADSLTNVINYLLGFVSACIMDDSVDRDLRLAFAQLRDALTTKRRQYDPRG